MGLKSCLGYARDELIAPLSPEECVTRLNDKVGGMFGDSPVVGSVGTRSLRLRKRLHNANNSFQTYLRATLNGEGKATRLSCRFGPHPAVVAFMLFWLVFATAIGIAFVSLGGQAEGGDVPMAVRFMPFLMLPFGIALFIGGRYWARHERQFLLDFLHETLDARLLSTSTTTRAAPMIER